MKFSPFHWMNLLASSNVRFLAAECGCRYEIWKQRPPSFPSLELDSWKVGIWINSYTVYLKTQQTSQNIFLWLKPTFNNYLSIIVKIKALSSYFHWIALCLGFSFIYWSFFDLLCNITSIIKRLLYLHQFLNKIVIRWHFIYFLMLIN